MKADLLLVIHFHQPIGNFDNIFQRVYERCYKPFLDIVSQFPSIKINIHISGCLLEWLESNQPALLKTVEKLVKRRQVELIGGGFYEPVLSIIPPRDRLGQLDMMKHFIKSRFAFDAKGAWITERIWEPELISSLAGGGIKYAVLDDTHFLYAGLKKDDTYGYFISEDNGKHIYIFPSDKSLRYSIPFGEPEKSISYMRAIAEKKDGVIFTYGDDAEKFGEWPGTYKWVYEDKWLIRFFNALLENASWLHTATLSECVKSRPPLGRVYLPTASYEEMLEWALPADTGIAFERLKEELKREGKQEQYAPFMRGGFFRNFLSKYDEANQMHKRMLYVSSLVERCEKSVSPSSGTELTQVQQELYKGQCNCAYWHGVFGGLYLYHLRKAVYEHLLKSENLCNSILERRENKELKPEIFDFDVDGFDEVILQNKKLWLCVKPSLGGSIVELDARDRFVNFINVLTRRRESYHEKIVQKFEAGGSEHASIHEQFKAAGGIASRLVYDRHRKAMLMDHFFSRETTLDDFEKCNYKEENDFISSLYDFKVVKDKKGVKLAMERKGKVYGVAVRLQKELLLTDSCLHVIYTIKNEGKKKREFCFGTEMAFIMPNANSSQYTYLFDKQRDTASSIDSRGITEKLGHIEVEDKTKECGIAFLFSKKCSLWRFPIKTISQSERAYEENYQGSVVVPHWRLVIEPNEKIKLGIDILLKL